MLEQKQLTQGEKPARKRGFGVISKYKEQNTNLPQHATHHTAGHDFEAAEEVVTPSIWKAGWKKGSETIADALKKDVSENEKQLKSILVPTGVKAYMGEGEFLQLANHSSNLLKRFSVSTNGVDVIDSDYYNDKANEGHTMFQSTSFGFKDVVVKKGERTGQGIFLPFLKTDQDQTTAQRQGEFGSPSK